MTVAQLKTAIDKAMAAKKGGKMLPEPRIESMERNTVQANSAAEYPSCAEPLTESVFRIFAHLGEGMRH